MYFLLLGKYLICFFSFSVGDAQLVVQSIKNIIAHTLFYKHTLREHWSKGFVLWKPSTDSVTSLDNANSHKWFNASSRKCSKDVILIIEQKAFTKQVAS